MDKSSKYFEPNVAHLEANKDKAPIDAIAGSVSADGLGVYSAVWLSHVDGTVFVAFKAPMEPPDYVNLPPLQLTGNILFDPESAEKLAASLLLHADAARKADRSMVDALLADTADQRHPAPTDDDMIEAERENAKREDHSDAPAHTNGD